MPVVATVVLTACVDAGLSEAEGRTDYLIFLAAEYPLGARLLFSLLVILVQLAGCATAGVGLRFVQVHLVLVTVGCATVQASIGQGQC